MAGPPVERIKVVVRPAYIDVAASSCTIDKSASRRTSRRVTTVLDRMPRSARMGFRVVTSFHPRRGNSSTVSMV